jgi:hypothetical protein
MDQVVPPRTEVPPLLNVPLAEIIDFLVQTGERDQGSEECVMQECIDRMCSTHILPRERGCQSGRLRRGLSRQAPADGRTSEQNFPDPKALGRVGFPSATSRAAKASCARLRRG